MIGAYGGLIADRYDKRRVLIGTQTAALVQALAIGLLTLTGVVQLWMVWMLALVLGFINVVDNPTRQSFAVEMVGREDLGNAVALNSVVINSSRIIGPAIAGLLIAVTNLASTFLVNAASFVAVIVCLVLMEPAALHRTQPVPRAKGQVRAGLRFAWRTWELRLPLLMMGVVGVLGYNFSVILPLLARYSFHRGAGTYGALAAAMGVGALAGALFAAARNRPTHRLLAAATLVFGVWSILVAVAPTLHLALVLLVPMGASGIVFVATTNSLLQLHSTGAMRGRVMALWAVVFLGSDAHRRSAHRSGRRPVRAAHGAGPRGSRHSPHGRRGLLGAAPAAPAGAAGAAPLSLRRADEASQVFARSRPRGAGRRSLLTTRSRAPGASRAVSPTSGRPQCMRLLRR